MILFITGWREEEKNLLMGLLDGHDLVFSIPFHDKFYNIFQGDTWWVGEKQLVSLRRSITKTNYQVLETRTIGNKSRCAFIKKNLLYNAVDFDFYTFDRKVIPRLIKLDPRTPQQILETMYLALFEGFYPHSTDVPKIIATIGTQLHSMGSFPNLFPDAKFIDIERDAEETLALSLLHSERFMRAECLRGRKNRKEIAEIYSLMYEILSCREEAKKIIERYPDRMMNVCFHEVLTNTEEMMKKIANFLDIPFSPILTQWTWMGKNMFSNGQWYADEEMEEAKERIPPIVWNAIRDSKYKFYKKKHWTERIWKHYSKKMLSKSSSILEGIAKSLETYAKYIN
jgi:hypothetical protein